MAYSTQRATSDGTLEYLALSIDYLNRTDLTVFINDFPVTPGVDWDWDGSNNAIRFPAPLPAGDEVLIARTTDLSEVLHVFSAQQGGGGSAKFTNLTMDENFLQLLLIAQEAKEGSSLSDVFQDLDMHGFRLRNVGNGDPNSPNDLPTMGQLFTLSNAAGTYANQAASSASAANTAKAGAQNAQAAAEAAVGDAQTAAVASNAAKTAAETAKTGAETARTQANAARDNAQGSATAAANSATQAASSASAAAASAVDAAAAAASVDTQKLSTDYYGPTAPVITWPGMTWLNSGTNVLSRRNAANTAWVSLGDAFTAPATPAYVQTYAAPISGVTGTFTVGSATANTHAVNRSYFDARTFGQGQTWQNMAGQRTYAVKYTNTTGRPIFVGFQATNVIGEGGAVVLRFWFGAQKCVVSADHSDYATHELAVSAIVPPGTVYEIDAYGVNTAVWYEYR